MAAERIFNVYIDYYYESLNWSFRLWINATRYNRLKEITINYSKIKSIEILTKKINNMIMKRLLYGLQTWLLFVKRIVYSAVLKIQCMLRKKHNDDFLNKNDTDNSTSSNKETIKASLLKSNRTIDKNSARNLIKSQSKIKKEVINSTKKQVTVANEIISKSNEDKEQKTIEDTDQVATSTNSSDQSPKQIIFDLN